MKVMIIGAGIGGLTMALSLHAAGIESVVYEAVSDLRPLGVGINLQPNAVRELIELGLGEALAAAAVEMTALHYYNKHGQLIWSEPRGLAAGYLWPQYAIGRGELQMMLLNAVKERIGPDNVFTGHQLVSFEQDGSGVYARFIDRKDGRQLAIQRGDALVGCDGIHSTVRAQLYPRERPPMPSGYIQWRGTADGELLLDGHTHAIIGFSGQRGVIYPIGGKGGGTRSRVNWITVLPSESATGAHEAWNRKATKERFFHKFQNWNFDWTGFADLICDTTDIYEFVEHDREPLARWSFGRVTLLGDAAHPMRPHGAQAGSQAIVDARMLAFSFATERTIEQALWMYDQQRRPMMNAVAERNREFGPSIIMELAEQRAPLGFKKIEDVIERRELEKITLAYKVEAGFDPATVNSRPSLTRRRGSSPASGATCPM